jgi:hypothetical protein
MFWMNQATRVYSSDSEEAHSSLSDYSLSSSSLSGPSLSESSLSGSRQFYCHLVKFVVTWSIFSRFGMFYQEKSGNLDSGLGWNVVGQSKVVFGEVLLGSQKSCDCCKQEMLLRHLEKQFGQVDCFCTELKLKGACQSQHCWTMVFENNEILWHYENKVLRQFP